MYNRYLFKMYNTYLLIQAFTTQIYLKVYNKYLFLMYNTILVKICNTYLSQNVQKGFVDNMQQIFILKFEAYIYPKRIKHIFC